MKRGVVLASVCGLLLAGWSASEAAAIRKWSVEASLLGGFNMIDADSGIKKAGTYGMRLGWAVTPVLMVEASLNSTSSESEARAFPNSDYTEDSYGIRALGTFRASEDVRVQPYVIAGFGVTDVQFDPKKAPVPVFGGPPKTFPPLEDETNYQEVGAGVRVGLWKRLSARGEVALKHFRANDVTQSDIHFTAGISIFLFGKK